MSKYEINCSSKWWLTEKHSYCWLLLCMNWGLLQFHLNLHTARCGCVLRKGISYFKRRINEDCRWDGCLVGRTQRSFYLFSFFETCFWSGRLCNIELSVVFRIKYKLYEWKTALLKIYFCSPDLPSSLCIQLSLVWRDTMSLLSHEAPEASLIISQIEQKAVPLIH